nr:vegetative cell wall protein gp1-like [Aegilops tauschii subsp. strangulata]
MQSPPPTPAAALPPPSVSPRATAASRLHPDAQCFTPAVRRGPRRSCRLVAREAWPPPALRPWLRRTPLRPWSCLQSVPPSILDKVVPQPSRSNPNPSPSPQPDVSGLAGQTRAAARSQSRRATCQRRRPTATGPRGPRLAPRGPYAADLPARLPVARSRRLVASAPGRVRSGRIDPRHHPQPIAPCHVAAPPPHRRRPARPVPGPRGPYAADLPARLPVARSRRLVSPPRVGRRPPSPPPPTAADPRHPAAPPLRPVAGPAPHPSQRAPAPSPATPSPTAGASSLSVSVKFLRKL